MSLQDPPENGKPIATVMPTVLNDAPGIATSIFFEGCGLRCRYCYNGELAEGRLRPDLLLTESEIKEIIQGRVKKAVKGGGNVLLSDYIVFSGGEALCKHTEEVMRLAFWSKCLGFQTKLFTNGQHAKNLIHVLPYIDEISLDFKTSEAKYGPLTKGTNAWSNLMDTFNIISSVEIPWEARTVLSRFYTTQEDLEQIAQVLDRYPPREWVLTPVQVPLDKKLLDESFTIGDHGISDLFAADLATKLGKNHPKLKIRVQTP